MSVEIKIRKGETVDKALRRLKKKIDREGIIKDAREGRGGDKHPGRRLGVVARPIPPSRGDCG